MAIGPHDPDDPGEDTGHAEPSSSADEAPADASRRDDELGDVDARWRQIVAELGDLDTAGTPPTGPEPHARTGRPDPRPGTDDGHASAAPSTPAPGSDPRAWQPDPAVEEAEDHFVPPDPGPVLGGDPLLTMAWTATVGVPALVVVAAVVWRDIPMSVLTAAGAVFLAGVGLLLWRMPHRRDDERDDDPGAVV